MILRFLFGPPSPEKIITQIRNTALQSAFRYFRGERVRTMLNFSQLDQTEQDRIFNEFTVTGLALTQLMLEAMAQVAEAEKQIFFRKLRDSLPDSYVAYLSELGVDKQYVGLWEKLLEMRCDEYRQDRNRYRGEVPEYDEGNPWLLITAIGGSHHVRRGATSPEDPLFNDMLKWLNGLAIEMEKILIRAVKTILK